MNLRAMLEWADTHLKAFGVDVDQQIHSQLSRPSDRESDTSPGTSRSYPHAAKETEAWRGKTPSWPGAEVTALVLPME